MVNCLSTLLAQKPNTTCETLSSGCFEESQECQFLLKQKCRSPVNLLLEAKGVIKNSIVLEIDRFRFQVDFKVILGLLGLFLILGLGIRKCFTLKFLFCNISMHIWRFCIMRRKIGESALMWKTSFHGPAFRNYFNWHFFSNFLLPYQGVIWGHIQILKCT